MPDVNIMEHIGTDGKFTDTFKDNIGAVIGEEHKGTKIFDSIPDVSTAFKVLADTKSAYGKKLEGVIQKPGEKATDQEKTDYRKSLQRELGASDSGDDYEITKPDDLPEGMHFSEEAVAAFRELFISEGIPVSTAKLLVEKFNEVQIARFQTHLEEENKIFLEECKKLDNAWKGDDMVKNGRTAYAAIMEFGTKDLTTLLKELKIYENAGDHELWHKAGFSPEQRLLWEHIGSKMKSSEHIVDEGSPEGSPEAQDKKTLSQIYTHKTSQELLLKKK